MKVRNISCQRYCGYRQLTIFAISEMIQPSAGQSSGYETEHEFGGSSLGSEAKLDGEWSIYYSYNILI